MGPRASRVFSGESGKADPEKKRNSSTKVVEFSTVVPRNFFSGTPEPTFVVGGRVQEVVEALPIEPDPDPQGSSCQTWQINSGRNISSPVVESSVAHSNFDFTPQRVKRVLPENPEINNSSAGGGNFSTPETDK